MKNERAGEAGGEAPGKRMEAESELNRECWEVVTVEIALGECAVGPGLSLGHGRLEVVDAESCLPSVSTMLRISAVTLPWVEKLTR